MTAGQIPEYSGVAGATRKTPTVCIHAFPLTSDPQFDTWQQMMPNGTHAVTPSIRHVPPQTLDSKIKHRSRLFMHIAEHQIKAVDPDAATLLPDLHGNITKCTGANLVIIKDQTIYIPTSRNILGGDSLRTVHELAPKVGLDFRETNLQVHDMITADKVWQMTTPYCVGPVTRINGIAIGDGKPGPQFRKMLNEWSALVGMDIFGQILKTRLTAQGAAQTKSELVVEPVGKGG